MLFRRIEAARERNPALKVIVVDPRRTDTAAFADLHLAILPGTDVALFHAMLHVMLWEKLAADAFIAAHTDGFEALRDLVREYSPQAAAEICGVRAEDIVTAARWFAGSAATLSLYCQGLNQSTSGTARTQRSSTCISPPATSAARRGPFSLTGPTPWAGEVAGSRPPCRAPRLNPAAPRRDSASGA